MHNLRRTFPHLIAEDSEAVRALAAVGLPPSFPIAACFFPQRVLTLADSSGMTNLLDLCTLAKVLEKLKMTARLKNFGPHSSAPVAGFQKALAARDRPSLQQYLPISASRDGIDLGIACRHAAQATALGVAGLSRRFVAEDTLETVGRNFKLTKQRVQQIEDLFFHALERVLDGISAEKDRLWSEWSNTGKLASLQTEAPTEVRDLTCAGIAELFKRSTDGREQRATQFERAVPIANLLTRQIAVFQEGVDLAAFLSRHAPDLSVHQFREWNETTKRFEISATNVARIDAPKAKEVVAALLEADITRAKAILDFLMTVPGLRSWPPNSLTQNCADWLKAGNFPDKALLNEENEPARRILRESRPLTADELIAFVREDGPLRLKTSSKKSSIGVEIHHSGLVFVTGRGKARFCDVKTLDQHLTVFLKTKSLVTTAYSRAGLFNSSYFIALIKAYKAATNADAGAAREIAAINAAKATEKSALYLSRIGQGRFRFDVLKNRGSCYVTGLQDPRFLRASHIKPWADCSNEHRLDWHNGLLLSPNYDHLFDRGLISFEDDGRILISNLIPAVVLEAFGIEKTFVGEPLCERTRAFMAIHRAEYFCHGQTGTQSKAES